jgi:hypothetical protein
VLFAGSLFALVKFLLLTLRFCVLLALLLLSVRRFSAAISVESAIRWASLRIHARLAALNASQSSKSASLGSGLDLSSAAATFCSVLPSSAVRFRSASLRQNSASRSASWCVSQLLYRAALEAAFSLGGCPSVPCARLLRKPIPLRFCSPFARLIFGLNGFFDGRGWNFYRYFDLRRGGGFF